MHGIPWEGVTEGKKKLTTSYVNGVISIVCAAFVQH